LRGERKASTSRQFNALLKYEFLWNLRKKKVQIVLIIIILIQIVAFVVPVLLSYSADQNIEPNPNTALSAPIGLLLFILAIAVGMNEIPEEFEHGRAQLLFSKPVSRSLIFLAKISAIFIILFAAYIFLYITGLALSIAIYGPQNYIYLAPILILGILISTVPYLGIVLFLGAVSRSSLMAALGSFGILIGLGITVGLLGAFAGQAWMVDYIPSEGQSGVIIDDGRGITTGTDALGVILSQFVINPSAKVNVTYITGIQIDIQLGETPTINIESEVTPLAQVALRAIGVAFAYAIPLMLGAWFFFRRVEIKE
jgi:ABC-type transport system involved in multi-copper enzyme maturation permease subunit